MNHYSAQIIGWDDEPQDDYEIVELSNGKFAVLNLAELREF